MEGKFKISNILEKKSMLFLMVIFLMIGLIYSMPIRGEELGQKVILDEGIANGDYIEFYDGEHLKGKVLVKIDGNIIEPTDNNIILLPTFTEDYNLEFYIFEEGSYNVGRLFVDGQEDYVPGDKIYNLNVENSNDVIIQFIFERDEDHNPGGMPHFIFPIVAELSGTSEVIEQTNPYEILLPDEWTSGTIHFKVKMCKQGGEIVFDDGATTCDSGTNFLDSLYLFGINNRDEINQTVSSGGANNDYLIVYEGFKNYGLTGLHLGNELVNTGINVVTNNLINVRVDAPMRMDHSYGLAKIDEVILTSVDSGNLSIFFGNKIATLYVEGTNVKGIKSLKGASHILNKEEGSVSLDLPDLAEETTTTVTVDIELLDGTVITKEINILRVAIELSYEGENKTIRAGYVMHKGYLYNNLPHNDDIFDAYLQVILYSNNKVVGYKQIQIDDEEFINSLGNDESGSMESFGPGGIVLFTIGEIEGATNVSVFLTNGPIDFNSDTLPSIEFGLGAGVEFNWEDKL